MDIRCGSCNKLFRVADEKIAGKGIRFKCSRCGEVITVTKEDYEKSLAGEAAAPTAPPAPPAPEPPKPVVEFEAREYQPPKVPAGVDDFNLGEPETGAAAEPQQQPDVAGAFSFGETPDQEAGGEVTLSAEDEQAAEAAFQFPADLISEPKRKPIFGEEKPEPEQEMKIDLGGEEAAPKMPEPMLSEAEPKQAAPVPPAKPVAPPPPPPPEPEMKQAAPAPSSEIFAETPAPEPKKGPVFTPPPRPAAPTPLPVAASSEEEIDLGQALAIPKNVASAEPEVSETGEEEAPSRAAGEHDGTIHPLASGNVTGAIAGLGCALPVVILLSLGFGMIAKFVPFLKSLPFFEIVAVSAAGIVGMGVVIGLGISFVQASAGKKLFFLLNILLGTLVGALLGLGIHALSSLVTGTPFSLARLIDGAAGAGVMAFLISILVVAARRIMLFTTDEVYDAVMTTLQKVGVGVSLLVLLYSVYGQGALRGKLERSIRETARRAMEAQQALRTVTPDGLTVVNASGYVDPASGDLVITGTLENTMDKPKSGWYIASDVYDEKQNVLASVSMLNGVQLYAARDYEVLAKQGKNVDELRLKEKAAILPAVIPAKGSVQFEMHLVGPPQGIASFLPVPGKFDLSTLLKEKQAPAAGK